MKKQYPNIIFSPYFGKLPDYFDLWAHSCSYNKDFLFIVFTDCTYSGKLPNNVCIQHLTFNQVRQLAQTRFDFKLSLDTPYKLCDYKPAFGYIFQDYLQNVSYWGHCDMDLIFGDIANFLPSQPFNKIGHLGHLCLYKNTPKLLEAFKLSSGHAITYHEVFSLPTHFAFDEDNTYGINAIFRRHKFSIYPFEKHIADVSCIRPNMALAHYQNPGFYRDERKRIFSVEGKNVYSHTLTTKGIEKESYAYIHFQKRHMKRLFSNTPTTYIITSAAFEKWQPITEIFIQSRQRILSTWKNLQQLLVIKRNTTPRFLRRKWMIHKIIFIKKLRGKKLL